MLTNWNTLDCRTCGSTLRANQLATTLVGGIGAGSGVLILGWCMMTSWSIPSILALLLWPCAVLAATSRFTELISVTDKSDPRPTNSAMHPDGGCATAGDPPNR